jgi:hypothetical protein
MGSFERRLEGLGIFDIAFYDLDTLGDECLAFWFAGVTCDPSDFV